MPKKKRQLPPAAVFRLALDADLNRAAKMLGDDPSLIDGAAFGSETALHFWAVENRPDIVVWLLDHGADPSQSSEDSSPLMDAAQLGNAEVCKALIDAGAASSYTDENGETALHKAASYGHSAVCTMLIKAGAEINAADICGETPWDQALLRKRKEIRELLERHGAKPRDPTDC